MACVKQATSNPEQIPSLSNPASSEPIKDCDVAAQIMKTISADQKVFTPYVLLLEIRGKVLPHSWALTLQAMDLG